MNESSVREPTLLAGLAMCGYMIVLYMVALTALDTVGVPAGPAALVSMPVSFVLFLVAFRIMPLPGLRADQRDVLARIGEQRRAAEFAELQVDVLRGRHRDITALKEIARRLEHNELRAQDLPYGTEHHLAELAVYCDASGYESLAARARAVQQLIEQSR